MAEKTYVQQRQDMIQTFDWRARKMAEMLKTYHHRLRTQRGVQLWPREDFQYIGHPLSDRFVRPPFYMRRHGQEFIRYQFNEYCGIDIGNFRVAPGRGKVDTPPPVILEETLTDSNAEEFVNNTDRPRKRTREFEDYQVLTTAAQVSEALSLKASLQLRQMFSYGSEAGPVQGETEITAALETEVSRSQSNSHSQEQGKRDTGGFEDDVPPWTNMIFYRDLWRTKSRQDATIEGDMDWTVWAWSHNDFDYRWDSKRDLESCLLGVGAAGDGRVFEEAFARYPWQELVDYDVPERVAELVAPVCALFTVSHEYDGAMRTRYRFEDERIPGHEEDYERWRAEQRASA